MAGEWEIVEFGQVNDIFDGPHATPQFSDEGPIFLGIDALDDGRLDLSQTRHVTDQVFLDWTRRVVPQSGDLVFSYETRIGQAALIPEGLKCCLGRRLALVRPKSDAVNSQYLLYYFLGPGFQEHLRAHTKPGSTVDRIHLKDFPSFPLVLPPRPYQDAIANLLGSLDDKIELNRRMAATLEEMAQALFKSWFVDFDPVRAKAEGRAPGLPAAAAALFPDRFGDDGLPEGWSKASLLDHARLISGGTPKTEEPTYWGGPILWASAKDVSRCADRFLTVTERTITRRGLEESATRMVPALSTVVVARGATTGRHCLFGREMAMNQTCYALHSEAERPFWLACTFSALVAELVHGAHGSVFDTITTTTLQTAKIVHGSDEVISAFERFVQPIYERILSLVEEAAALRALRDTLLPKLISGELRIKDASKAVEAA
ncbi:restriction endonuclease subunit S [Ancylobacter sp. A5.8]|uniref:restriction endonuclease subunit S n=1 Tax=Ancylobacter gelatini TaxID=2919920 RepID=UPI001F4EDD9A|nr:restriction endonuclease subunit S [Ancylobacter gelatini]MCJ8142170.1 restriction endonuclease subunit S [Ancylobacter gelatini]